MAYDYSGFDDSFQKLQFGPTDDMRLYNDRLNELRSQRSQFSGGGQGWETWNSRVQQARNGLQNATSAARSAWQQQNAKPVVMQPPPQTNPGTQPGTQPGASGVVQIGGGGTQTPPTSGNPGPVTGSESNPASGGGTTGVVQIGGGASGGNPTLPQPQPPMPPQQQLWWQMKMQQGQMGYPPYQPNPYQPNPYQNSPNGNAYGWWRNQYPQMPPPTGGSSGMEMMYPAVEPYQRADGSWGGGRYPQYPDRGQDPATQPVGGQPGPVTTPEGGSTLISGSDPWDAFRNGGSPPTNGFRTPEWMAQRQQIIDDQQRQRYTSVLTGFGLSPEEAAQFVGPGQYNGGRPTINRDALLAARPDLAGAYDQWEQSQRIEMNYNGGSGGGAQPYPGGGQPGPVTGSEGSEAAPAPLNQGNMGQYQQGDPRYQTYEQYLQRHAQQQAVLGIQRAPYTQEEFARYGNTYVGMLGGAAPQSPQPGGGPSYNQPFQPQPLSTPPKPPWLQAIESRTPMNQPLPGYSLPMASQAQWNGMVPSERQGYLALVPPAYRNDWMSQMQNRWGNMGASPRQYSYMV